MTVGNILLVGVVVGDDNAFVTRRSRSEITVMIGWRKRDGASGTPVHTRSSGGVVGVRFGRSRPQRPVCLLERYQAHHRQRNGADEHEVTESGSVKVPFVWADEETFIAAQAATGAAQRVITSVRQEAFDVAMLEAGAQYRQDDGSYRFENQYQYVAGMRPVA